MGALTDLSVTDFSAEVASESPAPGGGSVAALAGSLGAALVAMVCRLSAGKSEVKAGEEELISAQSQAEGLRSRFLELVDEDTAAFNAIMDAVRMPKDDEAQKLARSTALKAAKLGAAQPPLETLATARRTLELAESLVGRVNANVASDLGVAAELARAAAEGALLNVAINLSSLPSEDSVREREHESQVDIEAARVSATFVAAMTRREVSLPEVASTGPGTRL